MIIFLKIILLVLFYLIFVQDYKDRMVYWFLYFSVGLIGFFIQLLSLNWKVLVINSFLNISLICILIFGGILYSKIIKREKFINNALGIGDVFMFFSLTLLFPTIPFFTFFVFSLIFSLLLHQLLKKNYRNHIHVPLAGYMAIFFSFIIISSFFFNNNWLYTV